MHDSEKTKPKSNASALYDQRGVTGSSLGYGQQNHGYNQSAKPISTAQSNYGKGSSSLSSTFEKPYLKQHQEQFNSNAYR